MKLIYFDFFQSATEYYRSMPLDYIKHPSITITRSTERDITSHLLNAYDVIFLSRPSSDAHLKIMRLAKDMHKKIIVDYDDDCLHVPPTNPMHGVYEAEKANTMKCLALADEVWVATEGIKRSFRLYNKNIKVICNSHNDYLFKIEDKKPFVYNKKAMWRGGGSHVGDIYAIGVSEWLIYFINKNEDWNFHWLGQRFEWLEYRIMHGNFYYNSGASTIQFYKMMQESNPNIFIYPLADTLFNRSKSNCSVLESVYSGAAYFGSTNLPEFQIPGVKNLYEAQYFTEGREEELEQMNTDSWNYIKDNLLLSKINLLRIEALERFI